MKLKNKIIHLLGGYTVADLSFTHSYYTARGSKIDVLDRVKEKILLNYSICPGEVGETKFGSFIKYNVTFKPFKHE